MKKKIGLWIDHHKAVIVIVAGQIGETIILESEVEKQPGRINGLRSTHPYESQKVPADDSRERKFTGQLKNYYDEVISLIRNAESILIFGPGEAKNELKKRLEKDKLGDLIAAVETFDAMSDRQVAAKVREYFETRKLNH